MPLQLDAADDAKPLNLTLTHHTHARTMNVRTQCGKVDVNFRTSLLDADHSTVALQV